MTPTHNKAMLSLRWDTQPSAALQVGRPSLRRYVSASKISAIAALLSWAPVAAFGCSMSNQTSEQVFQEASSVFHARIVATELASENYMGRDIEYVLARYELLETFKGNVPESGTLAEPLGPSLCGATHLRTGSYYVIYLPEGEYSTPSHASWGYDSYEEEWVEPAFEKLRRMAREGT